MNYRQKEKEEKNKGISTVSFIFFPFTDLFLNVFFFPLLCLLSFTYLPPETDVGC